MFKFKPIFKTIQEANINHFVGVNTASLRDSENYQDKEYFLGVTADDYHSLKRGKHRFRISEKYGVWVAELNEREVAMFNEIAADYTEVESTKDGRIYEPKAYESFKLYYQQKYE